MYMMTISVAEARAQFSRIIDSASSTHERFEVTRNGNRAAVLLGADDFDALMETVEILGDSILVAQISVGLGELDRGETESAETVSEAMIRAGRLSQ
ncbi:MAG: prevent-host-death protein [Microbacteriaceae bacterium]|jgi:antitoxin YefM|nr:prevent-host-death protein [Microbacteriaceae bacterium]